MSAVRAAQAVTGSGWSGPVGTLAVGQGVTSVGDGAWATVWAIYLTRFGGLTPSEFALGGTLGGVLGLLASVPVGRLTDHVGPRRVVLAITVLSALALASFVLVDGFWTFLPVVLVAVACDKARTGAFQAFAVRLSNEDERLQALADQQVARSVGYMVGGAFGGLVLALDARAAFVALILVNAATSGLYALVLLRLPSPRPSAGNAARRARRGFAVLHDRPFAGVVAAGCVLALCWPLPAIALPLWIAKQTSLPSWMVGVLIVLNAVLVALLQGRASAIGDTFAGAVRKARLAGVVLALACGLFAVTAVTGLGLSVALIIGAGAIHALGEVLFVAGYWGLTLAMTPAGAEGEYQAMASTGTTAASVLAPIIMVPLVVEGGIPGWLVLAAAFLVAGALVGPLAARGRSR
jgi:hypothetical protein